MRKTREITFKEFLGLLLFRQEVGRFTIQRASKANQFKIRDPTNLGLDFRQGFPAQIPPPPTAPCRKLGICVLWFYLLALKDDEASVVIVFYQLVPVLAYVFGYVFLGETLTGTQLLAMGVIIFGTSIISFEIHENKIRLRWTTVCYMLIAVTCWALESVIFKAVALKENVWRSLFWEHVMMVAVGALIFFVAPTYRNHFLKTFRRNSAAVLSLNALNEGAYMLGNIVVAFAYMLAPVALVLLAESFQPIFVFAIGFFLTVFFPKLARENIHPRSIAQKLAAIIITGIGTYILLSST